MPLLSGDLRPEMVEALQHMQDALQDRLHHQQLSRQRDGSARPAARSTSREVMALFDHVIKSSKIGVRKPDPRIYRMMCEALGVDARGLRLSRRSRRQSEAGARAWA